MVEEATLPLAQHRQRHGLPADTPVAEGSHWLLLEKGEGAGKPLRFMRFETQAEREAYIDSHRVPSDQRFPQEGDAPSGVHDSQAAAWVTEFLKSGKSGSRFVSSKTPGGDHTLLHLGP